MAKKDGNDSFKNFKPLSIDLLVQAPWNYKNGDEILQAKLAANIKRSGQVENILVRPIADGKYEVVNGNHRLLALQSLGEKEVFVYDLGDISEAQAKRIAVETNETKFDSDPIQLARIVSEISENFEDFAETAPFDQDELDNFSATLKFDWDSEDKASDDDLEDDEASSGNKTETLLSVGGENFKVIKLELTSPCADRFTNQIQRLRALSPDSADHPITVISSILEELTDEQLNLDQRLASAKPQKKSSKKK